MGCGGHFMGSSFITTKKNPVNGQELPLNRGGFDKKVSSEITNRHIYKHELFLLEK